MNAFASFPETPNHTFQFSIPLHLTIFFTLRTYSDAGSLWHDICERMPVYNFFKIQLFWFLTL